MNLTPETTVAVTQTCPTCKGTKTIANPSWAEFNSAVKVGRANLETMEQWFRDRGEATRKAAMGREYWALPPEEETCGECEGTGRIHKSATLQEIAAFLKTLAK